MRLAAAAVVLVLIPVAGADAARRHGHPATAGGVRAKSKPLGGGTAGRWVAVTAPLTPPAVGPTPAPAGGGPAPTSDPAPPAGTTTTTTTAPPATPPPATLPKRVAVDEGEWYVRPSRPTVAAGDVEINLSDLGEDDHDLTVLDPAGKVVKRQAITAGEERQVTVTLAPGRYRLICSLPGHEGLGMKGELEVSSG